MMMVARRITPATLAALVLLAAAVHPAGAAGRCQRGALVGEVTHVRDGDTIEVAGRPIRLQGLAAPERDEPLGPEAAEAMRALALGRTARCELTGERSHDRCVGRCAIDGRDVAAALVLMGAARDCPRFSGGRYADEELAAVEAGEVIARVYRLPGYCWPRR